MVTDAELRGELAGIAYSPLVVVSLGWRRDAVAHPLDGFGFLVPGGERRQLLGSLWTSSIFPGRAPAGHVLLRCMAGGPGRGDLLEMDDAALTDLALSELRPLLGLRGGPVRAWVFRHRRAIAQYRPGHPARLRRLDALLSRRPGLLLAGSAYRGISVNHCVAESGRTAAAVLDFLAALPERAERSAS